jgi:hypothetical protein
VTSQLEVTAVTEQIPVEDSLMDRDVLDEGTSPPERQPASHRRTTVQEMREGETIDERLIQEEPEPELPADPDEQWEVDLTDGERIGRLVAPDEGAHPDEEKDVVARDVGIDGGAASAEEAAMHLVREDDY